MYIFLDISGHIIPVIPKSDVTECFMRAEMSSERTVVMIMEYLEMKVCKVRDDDPAELRFWLLKDQ
jgi:hypothetical protein